MLEGLSLGSYLWLVDYTGRLCRQGKARLSREVASILERLGTGAEVGGQRIRKLFGKTPLPTPRSSRTASGWCDEMVSVGVPARQA